MPQKNTYLKLICTSAVFSALALFGVAQTVSNGTMPPGTKVVKDEDNYTSYAVNNDDKTIFVKLLITDSLQKRKVLQHGLELWVDAKGKKNKVTGILFPLSSGGNAYPGGGNRSAAGGPPPSSQNEFGKKGADTSTPDLVLKRQDVELKGFAGDINGKTTIKSLPGGIIVGIRMAGDTLVYEASIPFVAAGVNPSANKSVSIGIVEKGIELPGFGEMDGGGPGGFGGDGGGPPGGGDGGGPPQGPPPGDMDGGGGVDFRRLFSTNVIWCKIKLDK